MLYLEQFVEIGFYESEKAKIVYRPFAGNEEILIRQKGKTRFNIKPKKVNYTPYIDICTDVLEKVY